MRITTMAKLVLVALTTASLLACFSPRPDLARLYWPRDAVDVDAVPPVIVVPGILGSRLRHRGSKTDLWPPETILSLLVDRQEQLSLRFDPNTLEVLPDDVEAYGLFEEALGRDFYGEILRTLEQSGGYVRGEPGKPVDPHRRRYYLFPYDWRQDNVVTARKLDALIEQIRRDYDNPELKVDVIGHSMGGLITRYYLRFGTEDVLDGNELPVNLQGAAKLNKVLLLGTPNLGSVTSVHRFLRGWKLGLRRIPTEVLATMPSIYELFPHPLNDWLVGSDGKSIDRDLFDVELWRELGWSVFDPGKEQELRESGQDVEAMHRWFEKRLERARRFVWALTVPLPQTPVRLVVFGGDCNPTPARLLLEGTGDNIEVRLSPSELRQRQPRIDYDRLMLEPGDGVVTKASLLARQSLNPAEPRNENIFFPLAYSMFLCENHDRLTGNLSFQDNLLNVLLTGERPWDQPDAMQRAPLPMSPSDLRH